MGNFFTKIKEGIKKIVKLVKLHIYEIFYFILIIILSKYIILNWNDCISMKFFDEFDGNNILFLVWIALIILFFYDIEAKDFKFHRKKFEITLEQFANADSAFRQTQINNMQNHSQREHSIETEERNNDNELSE